MTITAYASGSEVMTEMGRRIKAERIAMSVTQKEMAEKTGLSQKTISNLEAGKDVSFSTIIDVLRVLGRLQSLEVVIPEVKIRPSQVVELGKSRERVRHKATAEVNWKWGDEA